LVNKFAVVRHGWKYLPWDQGDLLSETIEVGNADEIPFRIRAAVNENRLRLLRQDVPSFFRAYIASIESITHNIVSPYTKDIRLPKSWAIEMARPEPYCTWR
jgi:hypothetical protein